MRKAREERERVKKFTERGIILNENHTQKHLPPPKRPQTVTNASSGLHKINQDFASQNSSRQMN